MLSVSLIDRHFRGGRLDAMVDALSANGLDLPLPLRVRLSACPAAGIALGLRRVVELTYGPTSLSRSMTGALLAHQDIDGSFGGDPLATACALSATHLLLREHGRALGPEAVAEVSVAQERALAAIAATQEEDGLFGFPADRTQQDRALTGAFILTLLARHDAFRESIRWAPLMTWFEARREGLEADTAKLWRLARVTTPPAAAPSRAVAAIAA